MRYKLCVADYQHQQIELYCAVGRNSGNMCGDWYIVDISIRKSLECGVLLGSYRAQLSILTIHPLKRSSALPFETLR